MVSLASEQWPDSVMPSTVKIDRVQSDHVVLSIDPRHLFDAWEQISLDLSKVKCQVICQFGPAPLQKTLLYGSRVMPLRIFENVHTCDVRGFIKSDNTIDVICTNSNTFRGNVSGWRVNTQQIIALEIRTEKGTLTLRTNAPSKKAWICVRAADELSCWIWSVASKENRRGIKCQYILEGLENSGVLTDKMLIILK